MHICTSWASGRQQISCCFYKDKKQYCPFGIQDLCVLTFSSVVLHSPMGTAIRIIVFQAERYVPQDNIPCRGASFRLGMFLPVWLSRKIQCLTQIEERSDKALVIFKAQEGRVSENSWGVRIACWSCLHLSKTPIRSRTPTSLRAKEPRAKRARNIIRL